MLYSKLKLFVLSTIFSCFTLLIFLALFAVLMSLLRLDDDMGFVFTFSSSLNFGLIAGLLHGFLSAAVIYFCRPVKLFSFCLTALFVTALMLGFTEFVINSKIFHNFLYDETIHLTYKTFYPRVESFIFNFVLLLMPSVVVGIINKSVLNKAKNKISLP